MTAGGRAIVAVLLIASVIAIGYVLGDIAMYLTSPALAGVGR